MYLKSILAVLLAAMISLGTGCSRKSDSGKPSGRSDGGKAADKSADAAGDKAADAKADAAATKFDQVKPGMTIEQVTQIMGAPTHQIAGPDAVQYHWQKGSANFMVLFKDGKVISTVSGSDRRADAAGKAKDFGKIKVGMTRDEVVGILGHPTTEGGSGDSAGKTGVAHWVDDKTNLTVGFKDGKVIVVNIQNDTEGE